MSKDVTESVSTGFAGTDGPEKADEPTATVGTYTWRDFMQEFGYGDEIEDVYRDIDPDGSTGGLTGGLFSFFRASKRVPDGEDWERVKFDPAVYLGFPPDDIHNRFTAAEATARTLDRWFERQVGEIPVAKGQYTWEHFKWDYYYDEHGRAPRGSEGGVEPFEPEEYLGFDPDDIEGIVAAGAETAAAIAAIKAERTVYVNPELDEDAFFSTPQGQPTLVNRYDLEKAVPIDKKRHFVEVERYWVNKPYAFVIIFHSIKENEKKYYTIDPYLNEIEAELVEYLSGKLRTSIKYSDDDVVVEGTDEDRGMVLEEEIKWLLDRNDLREPTSNREGKLEELKALVGVHDEPSDRATESEGVDGIVARPEPAVLEDDIGWLTDYQVEKLLYVIRRDFVGYERIDPIKHDINVEDISCDGYNSPVFVYHTDYENLITNIRHGETRLDNFVIKLAQRSGKGISKRQPQVDATLPDGSRAQLTLGTDVSDHGTNYTIRQFKDVPFTPVDLVNWKTFSMDEMAFLWLCIESNMSLVFAGGTASGKTTSLNAVSLFIPSNTKIVSIEDTREVELPQRNWVASVTRPSFSQDNTGDIDEFDLLEAALRQRPDYIIMGEVRGEEGRTLFQVMSTGHTTYTTFHADNVDEVLKRFTTDPINVSKTLFTALDLVSVQTQTKVQGRKVRRNTMITEINSYDAENNEISVQEVYQWQPEGDEFLHHADSQKLQEIAFERGWSDERLDQELFKRRVILSYLITKGFSTYTEVAATIQAFINDPETILTLIANEELKESLEDLREMESVLIDVDPAKEALVPRPDPDEDVLAEAREVLEEAEDRVFEEYRGRQAGSLIDALPSGTWADDITALPEIDKRMLANIIGNEEAATDAPPDDTTVPQLEAPPGTGTDTADAIDPETADGTASEGPSDADHDEFPSDANAPHNRKQCRYVDTTTGHPCRRDVSGSADYCNLHQPAADGGTDTTTDTDTGPTTDGPAGDE